MKYVLETEIDGKTHSMMVDSIPTSITMRLLEHADPVVTLIAEKAVL